MKGKTKRLLAATAITALALSLLSGCQHGIGETLQLVKEAEQAKESVMQMDNAGSGKQVSVGTLADPSYQSSRLNLIEFELAHDGTQYTARWTADTNYSTLRIQIYADTDADGADGVKVASFDGVSPASEQAFRYDNLDAGTYYFYIKAVSETGLTDIMYCRTPIAVSKAQKEGVLQNVEVQVSDGAIHITWSPSDTAQRYRAILIDPDNTDTVLDETTVVDTRAKLDLPEGCEAVYVAVAEYIDGNMGAYELILVDLAADEAADSTETEGEGE